MAPLGFENSIDVASLTGTWMGTIFTGVGLLAVLTQLNTLLNYVKAGNRQWIERSAGKEWASFIHIDHLPSNGIQEGVVPCFSGWLQYFYVREEKILVSQDDLGFSGESSWSDLFDRMNVEAAVADAYGGQNRQSTPKWKHEPIERDQWIRSLRPKLGDALVENGRIMYGFSAAEFAALIILCGFHPEEFRPNRSHHSVSFFGQMRVAEYDHFSHVARFDSHHGFWDKPDSVKTRAYSIPVAHSLNLAFGMIRVKGRSKRAWVIPSDSEASLGGWGAYATPHQLGNIIYAFQRFVGVSGLTIAEYSQRNDAFEDDDVQVLRGLLTSSGLVSETPLSDDDLRNRAREVLNATHAIAAIQPWALLPVLPRYLVFAIESILDPFFLKKEDTVGVLQRELNMIPDRIQSRKLDQVVADKHNFFGRHCYQSLTYYKAMSLVFSHNDIDMDNLRLPLAANVGTKLFWDRFSPLLRDLLREEVEERLEPFTESLRRYLEGCYLQVDMKEKSPNVPEWAVNVYANYLWGWVTNSIPSDPDLITHFRRRVFLA